MLCFQSQCQSRNQFIVFITMTKLSLLSFSKCIKVAPFFDHYRVIESTWDLLTFDSTKGVDNLRRWSFAVTPLQAVSKLSMTIIPSSPLFVTSCGTFSWNDSLSNIGFSGSMKRIRLSLSQPLQWCMEPEDSKAKPPPQISTIISSPGAATSRCGTLQLSNWDSS